MIYKKLNKEKYLNNSIRDARDNQQGVIFHKQQGGQLVAMDNSSRVALLLEYEGCILKIN